MEKRKIRTFVKMEYTAPNGKKIELNDYIKGRVHGFMTILCGEDKIYANRRISNDDGEIAGYMFTTYTTEEQYEQFKQVVNRHYSDLCEFDVKIVK